jgi:hypothetical protein
MEPADALHVTDVSARPTIVATNCWVPPLATVATDGLTRNSNTLTVVVADFAVSTLLVAVTVTEPTVAGAVKLPFASIDPAEAVQVTDVSDQPVTVAVNACVALAGTAGFAGLIDTAISLTVTVAVPDLVVSAWLVAVTVTVPGVAGAVKRPFWSIVPADALHVTAWLEVPLTVAENCCVRPVRTDAVVGVTVTVGVDGGVSGHPSVLSVKPAIAIHLVRFIWVPSPGLAVRLRLSARFANLPVGVVALALAYPERRLPAHPEWMSLLHPEWTSMPNPERRHRHTRAEAADTTLRDGVWCIPGEGQGASAKKRRLTPPRVRAMAGATSARSPVADPTRLIRRIPSAPVIRIKAEAAGLRAAVVAERGVRRLQVEMRNSRSWA